MTEMNLSRADRRRMERSKNHKPRRNDKASFNPVIRAVIERDTREKFAILKGQAESYCIASNDVTQIVHSAGFLLFVTLRALNLDQLEIEDRDVCDALALMGLVLGDIRETETLTQEQRRALMDGMDILDALIQPLSKEALAVAWWDVEKACASPEGVGTQDLNALLDRARRNYEVITEV